MLRGGLLTGSLLLALAAPAYGQLPGALPGGFGAQGTKKSTDDLLLTPSNPGIAPPLDIRIQGEGISLPQGVAEDDQPAKPPAEQPRAAETPAKTEKKEEAVR